ncbi:MAG: ATP-binding protein [Xanthomonadales bacterium]|jgi:two-component system sensor histidine kinase CpxA|nr:ATP-binding protein [Xanthomonadales bacterium]
MPRLFWRLFLALWVSIMAFVILTALINVALSRQEIPDPPEVAFARSADKAERLLGAALRRGGPDAARARLRELPWVLRNQLYLFDEEGRELLGRDRFRKHLERDDVPLQRRSIRDRNGDRWSLVVLRGPPPGRVLEPGVRGIVFRILLAGLFSAILSYFLARSLTRPLERLGSASRRLAEGDLSTRVGPPLADRRDEFGILARDLDGMAGRLQEAERANRRLLRDVSHELRSPLARQRVALELARSRMGDQAAVELDRIELESERLEKLVDEVLSLLRETSGAAPFEPEDFDLAELLQDLADVVSYELPPGAPGIDLRVPETLPVRADRELIWRAVENVLRNALLHSDPTRAIELHVEPGDDVVTLRIADRGPGVPEARLERLFDPFTRADDARDRNSGGHGLGLAIAAAALRRHGGSIEARNRTGGGLELVLAFPRNP